MKKALSLILALAMMLTMLVGCGDKNDSNNDANNDSQTEDLKWPERTSTFSLATAPAVTLMFVPATWLTP